MPEFKRIDRVDYNVDHARAIGKEKWVASEVQHHFQHLSEGSARNKAMADVYDQLVAPIPTASPAIAKAN
jgi:hypothetical protein